MKLFLLIVQIVISLQFAMDLKCGSLVTWFCFVLEIFACFAVVVIGFLLKLKKEMNLKESSLHVSNKFVLEEFKKLRKKKHCSR